MDQFAVLNRYHISTLTYFFDKLKQTTDGDGNLLDHSLILYGSTLSDGNEHNHDPLPVLLVGGASGTQRRPPFAVSGTHADVESGAEHSGKVRGSPG